MEHVLSPIAFVMGASVDFRCLRSGDFLLLPFRWGWYIFGFLPVVVRELLFMPCSFRMRLVGTDARCAQRIVVPALTPPFLSVVSAGS